MEEIVLDNYYANEQEEYDVMFESQSLTERQERDRRLTECDWVVVKAQEEGTHVPAEWVTYRQALRDITSDSGFPFSHTWPAKPE